MLNTVVVNWWNCARTNSIGVYVSYLSSDIKLHGQHASVHSELFTYCVTWHWEKHTNHKREWLVHVLLCSQWWAGAETQVQWHVALYEECLAAAGTERTLPRSNTQCLGCWSILGSILLFVSYVWARDVPWFTQKYAWSWIVVSVLS